jgi:hypothetical protein
LWSVIASLIIRLGTNIVRRPRPPPAKAAAVSGQGRAFLTTLAISGLWLIPPVGFQTLPRLRIVVNTPMAASPVALIRAVRGHGYPEVNVNPDE